MRSERQREIMAQLEAEQRAAKKNRGIVLFRIISILYVILAAAFVVLLWRMDVLPAKYLYGGIAVLAIASIFIVPVMYSKNGKKGRKIGATIAAFLLSGFSVWAPIIWRILWISSEISRKLCRRRKIIM